MEYPNMQITILRDQSKKIKVLPYDFAGFAISMDPTTPIEHRLKNLSVFSSITFETE